MDDSILSSNNTTTDSFFKPYMITRGKSDTEKEDDQSQTKHKYSNTSKSIDEQPNKRMCKAQKFEAIQYLLGPNEEYITIRRCGFDIWERNEDNMHRYTVSSLMDTAYWVSEQGSGKLKQGALSLQVGNGHRATVEAIGEYHLCLPSRLVLILHNCHYAPSITRGIISVSHLYDDGFINHFDDKILLVSRNNLVYFCAILRGGIYEIDLSSSNTNDSSMYVVCNKRTKLNLNRSLLWQCRLGHISKKRIEKLQDGRLLNSTDIKSFEKCVSCMSGKMARKPYLHQVERAKDLLRLIHTDVYGPFKIVSRQRASYFVTFIDDFSRYGEYMSQEFLDHLKEHGIISHQTPPYTPQHNGYPKETMGYSFYYLPENKVFVARNAKFFKNSLITQEASESLKDLEIIQEEDTQPSIDTRLHHDEDDQEINEPQSDINPIHRSTRTRHAPDRMCLHVDAEEHELGNLGEPANYKAALLDPESDKWLGAMNPVVDIRAIRILIAITAFYDYEIWKMDIKTAFLNGHLFKEVYMVQPEGFVNPKFPNRVCKFKRSIYGLKQASRQWNKRFDDKIKKFGFSQNRDEPCVYMKVSGSYVTFLILYVNDILIMGNNIHMLQDVKSYLGRCFAMKDQREAAHILGIKIYRDISKRLISDMKRELKVSCYTDVGYLTNADDLKSQIGYVFILNRAETLRRRFVCTNIARTGYGGMRLGSMMEVGQGDKAASNTYPYIQVDVVIGPATAGHMYGVNVKLQECFADNRSAELESSSRDE
ncbi:retrotransposon protein, putative, ty1-copia subclass [Tanacetum coccineum]